MPVLSYVLSESKDAMIRSILFQSIHFGQVTFESLNYSTATLLVPITTELCHHLVTAISAVALLATSPCRNPSRNHIIRHRCYRNIHLPTVGLRYQA